MFCFILSQTSRFWYQCGSVYSSTSPPFRFNITYGEGSNLWLQALPGYSYYVTDIDTCSAQYGYCWDVSCSYYGTPGSGPIDSCTANCVDYSCQNNGDVNASCDLEYDRCDCTSEDHFIPSNSGTTCEELLSPDTCTMYVNKSGYLSTDADGTIIIESTYMEWDAVKMGNYKPGYQLRYFDGLSGELKYKNIKENFRFTTEATILWYIGNTSLNVSVATKYTDDDGETTLSRWTVCNVITTSSPSVVPSELPTYTTTTRMPTHNPSYNPSIIPSYTPTEAPTYDLWIIKSCMIEIFGENNWTLTWEENDNKTDIPDEREILVSKDGDQFFDIIENDEKSPKNYFSNIDSTTNVTLTVKQKRDEVYGMQIIPESVINCDIVTYTPTVTPTIVPTYIDTTNIPSNIPTNIPTSIPTNVATDTPTYISTYSDATDFGGVNMSTFKVNGTDEHESTEVTFETSDKSDLKERNNNSDSASKIYFWLLIAAAILALFCFLTIVFVWKTHRFAIEHEQIERDFASVHAHVTKTKNSKKERENENENDNNVIIKRRISHFTSVSKHTTASSDMYNENNGFPKNTNDATGDNDSIHNHENGEPIDVSSSDDNESLYGGGHGTNGGENMHLSTPISVNVLANCDVQLKETDNLNDIDDCHSDSPNVIILYPETNDHDARKSIHMPSRRNVGVSSQLQPQYNGDCQSQIEGDEDDRHLELEDKRVNENDNKMRQRSGISITRRKLTCQ